MKVLFKTIAGSRLYGLAHEDSDWDYYTVVDRVAKRKPAYHTHSIVDGLDSTVVDFGTWVNDCQKGVPQALEAMFSQKAEYDEIAEFRAAFVGGREYYAYNSVMKVMKFEHADSFKHRRHMLRLGINLSDLRMFGRFNPTLSRDVIDLISAHAEIDDMETCYESAKRVAYGLEV